MDNLSESELKDGIQLIENFQSSALHREMLREGSEAIRVTELFILESNCNPETLNQVIKAKGERLQLINHFGNDDNPSYLEKLKSDAKDQIKKLQEEKERHAE